MQTSPNRVRVGVSVFVKRNDGKYLFGKRKNSHGEGCWANPGGHLEFGESIETCAKREVLEETGMALCNLHFGGITNDIFDSEGKHYITIHMLAETECSEAHVLEPDKVLEWGWFDTSSWPNPLFLSIQNLLANNPGLF